MKLQWYEDLPHVWQEVVDQALHFAAGFLIGAINPWLSIGAAVLREIIQNWGDEDNNYLDMAVDILVWTLGAVAASLVF